MSYWDVIEEKRKQAKALKCTQAIPGIKSFYTSMMEVQIGVSFGERLNKLFKSKFNHDLWIEAQAWKAIHNSRIKNEE